MGPLLPFVKFGVTVIASVPVSKIANDIIKNNVTIVTQADKVKVATGGFIIGAMIQQSLSKTMDAFVDAAVKAKNSIKKDEETGLTEVS